MNEPTSILARALNPAITTPDDGTSEKILDAALALAVASGLRHLTMDDVAQRAGVGRITVYRRFSDKRGLVDALMLRESRRCLTELRRAVDVKLPVEEQIVEGFVTALRIAREHPLLARLVRVEPETVLATVSNPEVFAMLRMFMGAQMRAAHKANKAGKRSDVDSVAEMVVRLGISFVLIPTSIVPLDDEAAIRKLAKTMLVPIMAR